MADADPARGTILVADDDDEVRIVLALRFAGFGYEVVAVSNGAELIDALETCTPDAMFVDLLMPGILGASALEYARAVPRLASIPTAIVTASPELAPAGYCVFAKPVAFDQLLGFVQSAAVGPNREELT